jgi:hypothetical protein
MQRQLKYVNAAMHGLLTSDAKNLFLAPENDVG